MSSWHNWNMFFFLTIYSKSAYGILLGKHFFSRLIWKQSFWIGLNILSLVFNSPIHIVLSWVELMIGLIMWSYVLMNVFELKYLACVTHFHVLVTIVMRILTWFYIYLTSIICKFVNFQVIMYTTFCIALSRFYEFAVSHTCVHVNIHVNCIIGVISNHWC